MPEPKPPGALQSPPDDLQADRPWPATDERAGARSARVQPPEGSPAALGRSGGGRSGFDAQPLCATDALVEREQAHVFDILLWGQPARGFAMRFDGEVVAYVNRCAHVPTEMDWQEGRFLDMDRRWIVCSIHGATYEPANGRCVGGPCGGGRLMPIATVERQGQVYWYPSADIRPLEFDAPPAPQGLP